MDDDFPPETNYEHYAKLVKILANEPMEKSKRIKLLKSRVGSNYDPYIFATNFADVDHYKEEKEAASKALKDVDGFGSF